MEIEKNLDCLFCQIVASKKTILVGENEKVIAILDKYPVSAGHTLLITKKHFSNISEVGEESWKYLLPLLKDVVGKLEAAFKPQGFNFISNMNEIAYQSIPHFHLHIIPKYEKNQGFIWTVRQEKPVDLIQAAKKLGI